MADIDLVFPATAAAGQRVKDALMILPDRAAKEIEPQWFEEGENIRVADAFVVDIMLNANGQTYDTLRRYGQTLDLDGIPVRTVNLEGFRRSQEYGRGYADAPYRDCCGGRSPAGLRAMPTQPVCRLYL
jgi:hypothetical protein